MGAAQRMQEVTSSIGLIDEIIHQKVRLGVMSALIASGECDFRFLRDTLGVTDGNLSIHITKLDDAGYIVTRKEFVGRKPHTSYTATDEGCAAFQSYLRNLERIVESNKGG